MTKKLNLLSETLIFTLLIALCAYLAIGGNFTYATLDGIKLWAACVLPSLFPYFFITAILSSMKITGKFATLLSPITRKLFRTGGLTGYAFFISLLSGYPVGAKTVADLKNKNLISEIDSVRAAAFCSTSSPMFLIGSVGNVTFRSNLFGLCLFLTHIICAFLIGIIYSFYKRKDERRESISTVNVPLTPNADNILYESAYSSVISVLVVGGLITFFYLLTEVLFSIGALKLPISALTRLTGDAIVAESAVYGLFECTRALKALSLAKINLFTLPTAAAICGFGGLSVIVQSLAYLKSAKIKAAPFILAKIISAALNFTVGIVVSLIFL